MTSLVSSMAAALHNAFLASKYAASLLADTAEEDGPAADGVDAAGAREPEPVRGAGAWLGVEAGPPGGAGVGPSAVEAADSLLGATEEAGACCCW